MGSIKAIKLNSNVSAYIQLPAGTHTIGDKIYTVVDKTEGTGDNIWKTTVIETIVPVSNTAE